MIETPCGYCAYALGNDGVKIHQAGCPNTPRGRTTYWGHWGVSFLRDGKLVEFDPFPVGPQGPVDAGDVGERFRLRAAAWREFGRLPSDASASTGAID